MIMAEVIVLAILVSLLAGGSLRNLAREPLRGEWALLLLFAMQALWPTASSTLGLTCEFSIIIWLLMMAGLAAVLMINAPRRWMLGLAALGIAANILVIGLNQAMPVDIRAASEIGATRAASRAALDEDCLHEELTDGTRVPLLADVIAVPGPAWQRAVLSLGDVVLALGLAAWVFAASRPGHGSCARSDV